MPQTQRLHNDYDEVRLLAELARNEGWKILDNRIREQIDAHTEKLKKCSEDELKYFQGIIYGYENVFSIVENAVHDWSNGN